MERNSKVLGLVGDLDGCTLWRVLLPFTELQKQGYRGIEWGPKDDNRLASIAHLFDAVVLPRLHWPKSEWDKGQKWIDALHRAGLAVIYEMDDDLISEDFARRIMADKDMTQAEADERRDCIIHAVNACDGVTVSGQRLATMVREITENPVRVVPNYIDLRWFKKVQKMGDRKVTGLTIGWAGGARPDADIELVAGAWARIAEKYPQVMFVIQGHHSQVFYDRVPNERIAMIDWMPIDQYPIGLLNFDIGCCPLADTKFNRAKTYIKAMEYAASGAAVVASPTVYDHLIEDGETGFICETEDEWFDALSRLVEDYRFRHDMSKALLAEVRKNHSLETQAWRWVETWNDLVYRYQWKNKYRVLTLNEV